MHNSLIGRLSSFTHLLGREALFLVVLGRGSLRLMRMTPWGGTNAAVVVAPVRVPRSPVLLLGPRTGDAQKGAFRKPCLPEYSPYEVASRNFLDIWQCQSQAYPAGANIQ